MPGTAPPHSQESCRTNQLRPGRLTPGLTAPRQEEDGPHPVLVPRPQLNPVSPGVLQCDLNQNLKWRLLLPTWTEVLGLVSASVPVLASPGSEAGPSSQGPWGPQCPIPTPPLSAGSRCQTRPLGAALPRALENGCSTAAPGAAWASPGPLSPLGREEGWDGDRERRPGTLCSSKTARPAPRELHVCL